MTQIPHTARWIAAVALCVVGGWGCGPRPPRLAVTGPKPRPVAPPAPQAIDVAVERGIAFLVTDQNKNGSWGSARRTKGLNIYAPVPGAHHAFRTAVTALCVMALIETGADDAAAQAALARGEAWLLEHLPRLRRATPRAIYNVWGHAYAIQALVRMLGREPANTGRQEQIRQLIRGQIGYLVRYESVDGGWGYYDFRAHTQRPTSQSTSFITATALIALKEAQQAGIEPPPKLVKRAVASVRRQRKPDFSYLYAYSHKYVPMVPINRPGGSLGRSQACNAALRMWGDRLVTDAVLRTWLDRLFARNGWLDIGRKRPIPHESWFAVAGYFFYYGHYYAATCIDMLPRRQRPRFRHHLAAVLLRLQEKDGSWWDYPFYDYHQQYGTALALMALQRCRALAACRRGGCVVGRRLVQRGLSREWLRAYPHSCPREGDPEPFGGN